MDRVIVYVDKAPTVRIEDGLAHIQDRSGKVVFERVMPVGAYINSIAVAQEAIAKWRLAHLDSNAPIPIGVGRKRRG